MSDVLRSYARTSTFRLLTDDQEKAVHQACLDVLEHTGVSTTNDRLLKRADPIIERHVGGLARRRTAVRAVRS